ncbi:monocarboxylate transporter 13-like [Lingula anatina]|uniref:Monocarboxylate transporter 13-like n=1 Tax=Lingula anatina TaxID=7574 RepID=A0A1S3IHC5_LINAN|nr:monocarboxylate transporter 13-like [Lingula anatina]|eukprot:XP_013396889.1 monocarboxylate transporter 13-like [Lingula anatina]
MSALFDSDFNLGGFFSLGSAYSVYSKPRSNSVDSFDSGCSPHNAVRYLHPPVQHANSKGQKPQHSKNTECESGIREETVYYKSNANYKDIDRGWAWAVLVASFFCNCINIGINNSVGVHNAEFLIQFPEETRSYVSLAGSLQNSVCGLTGLVSGIIANKYSCRTSILLGAIISAVGFIGTAFATNITEIIATFGIVVGIGTGLVYTSTTVCVGQYFHKRRPMALGITAAGMALGQFMCPPLFQFLIDAYSWRGSAFIIAGLCLNNCVFGTIMKPLKELHVERKGVISSTCKSSRLQIQKDTDQTSVVNGDHEPRKESSRINVDAAKDDTGQTSPQALSNDATKADSSSCFHDDSVKHACQSSLLANGNKHSTLESSALLSLSIGAFSSMTSNISQHFVSNGQLNAAQDNAKSGCLGYMKAIVDTRPLKSAPFISLSIAVFFWASASLICSVHLIAYTLQHGTTPQQGAILLSIYGVGNILSRLLAGAATNDKEHVDQVTLGAGVMGISALLMCCLPLFIQSYWSQILFAALYGVYSTVLIPLLAPMTVETVGLSSLGAGFGYLMVMSGIGCAIGPPLAGNYDPIVLICLFEMSIWEGSCGSLTLMGVAENIRAPSFTVNEDN